ncbi:MAG: PQQ-binding-like beta-propeller repeat protein [Deltaproteobacteria bacterium]|nr:PQQ-binding-like beta-propeller repeat protein [Deltaproteobacteria bacterium]
MKWLIPLLIGFLLAAMGCSGVKPVSSDWNEKAGVQVLRMRWVKKLSPSLPNFLIGAQGVVEENDRFDPVELASAGFDLDRRRAFMGASMGGLYCLDMRHGETVWRFDLDDAVGSAPLYDSGHKAVFFGADDGVFYSVHARSGRKLWSVETGGEIRRKAVMHSGTLYVINADNTLFALDPENGEIIWQYRRPPVEGFSSTGHAGLTFHGDYVFTGFSDGFVAAFDAVGGDIVWSQDLAAEVSTLAEDGTVKLIDVDATPVVVDGVVIAASVAGGMRGLDAEKGTVLWTRPEITGVTGLATEDGIIFTARSAFGLTAIGAEGDVLWSKQFSAGVLQDPVVYNDVLLISDSEFGLYVVSAFDGRLLQRIDQREGFFARPSVQSGYVLVIGNNGTLYAMSIL